MEQPRQKLALPAPAVELPPAKASATKAGKEQSWGGWENNNFVATQRANRATIAENA